MSHGTQSFDSPPGRVRARGKPAWIDREEYPFESKFAETDRGLVHYVDEGSGRPLVMLHGNPTWSFLYRHLIEGLADDYRCIAPDLLGFGLSETPRDWSYRVRDHAAVVAEFLDGLDLSDATLVLQGWGGPIGMHYAIERPAAVDSFVVTNTAAWPVRHARNVQAYSRAVDTPIVRLLNRRYNVPGAWLMPLGFGDLSRWTPTLRRHYERPLAESGERPGGLAFGRELLDATPFLADLWERRDRIAGAPALICWGARGPLFRRQARLRWQVLFPEARTVEYETAGHYVPEEKGQEMVPEMRQFLDERVGR